MIHIKANNGDFFIEESKILTISPVQIGRQVLAKGTVEQLFFIEISTLEGDFFVEDFYESMVQTRRAIIREVKEIWQSN